MLGDSLTKHRHVEYFVINEADAGWQCAGLAVYNGLVLSDVERCCEVSGSPYQCLVSRQSSCPSKPDRRMAWVRHVKAHLQAH